MEFLRFSLQLGKGVLVTLFLFFSGQGEVSGVHRVASGFSLVRITRRRWGTCAGIMHESPCTIYARKRVNHSTSNARLNILEHVHVEVQRVLAHPRDVQQGEEVRTAKVGWMLG